MCVQRVRGALGVRVSVCRGQGPLGMRVTVTVGYRRAQWVCECRGLQRTEGGTGNVCAGDCKGQRVVLGMGHSSLWIAEGAAVCDVSAGAYRDQGDS